MTSAMPSGSRHQPLTIDPDHPAFAGHFPQRPVVPGVVLLDAGLRALAAGDEGATCTIGVAKFLSAVGPGEALRLEIERSATTRGYALRIFAGPGPGDAPERLAVSWTVTFEKPDD